ncbi:MAG: hypothetical protein J6V82_04945, partial [Clostridia bacterium]|nr:hypothetical protein [Clostridia bacterium]
RFDKYVTYRRVKTLQIEAEEGFGLTIDGELADGASFAVEVLPRAIRFAVPGLESKQTDFAPETASQSI